MRGDLEIGSEFAGYRIQALAGRGGMGMVYRAEHLRLGRTVALKVLASALVSDQSFRERFERESRLAALIDHPNIIPVYEEGEAEGLLFIAMRWVEGSDLREILDREGPLEPERVVGLMEQVASALDAAHERGLLHRDVKPGNVLVTRGAGGHHAEHVYLTDFGIAKLMSASALTRTGSFLGTPDYAAPEQFQGQELDPRADVYALGCLLFHCLSGHRPYERTEEVAVMYAHLHEPPPSISAIRPDVPAAFDSVIAKAMAKHARRPLHDRRRGRRRSQGGPTKGGCATDPRRRRHAGCRDDRGDRGISRGHVARRGCCGRLGSHDACRAGSHPTDDTRAAARRPPDHAGCSREHAADHTGHACSAPGSRSHAGPTATAGRSARAGGSARRTGPVAPPAGRRRRRRRGHRGGRRDRGSPRHARGRRRERRDGDATGGRGRNGRRDHGRRPDRAARNRSPRDGATGDDGTARDNPAHTAGVGRPRASMDAARGSRPRGCGRAGPPQGDDDTLRADRHRSRHGR